MSTKNEKTSPAAVEKPTESAGPKTVDYPSNDEPLTTEGIQKLASSLKEAGYPEDVMNNFAPEALIGLLRCSIAVLHDSDLTENLIKNPKLPINYQDEKGHSTLHFAINTNHAGYLPAILARKDLNPNIRDKSGQTPLTLAIYSGNVEAVELLLARDDIDPNLSESGSDQSPLHIALQNANLPILQKLLSKNGINPNLRNKQDLTPLLMAAKSGWAGAVKAFLSRDDIDLNVRDRTGLTPLAIAATSLSSFSDDAFGLILAKDGVDANSADNKGYTPLHLAAENGYVKRVQLLLDANKGVDKEAKTHEGKTAYDLAVDYKQKKVAQYLSGEKILFDYDLDIDLGADAAGQHTPGSTGSVTLEDLISARITELES